MTAIALDGGPDTQQGGTRHRVRGPNLPLAALLTTAVACGALLVGAVPALAGQATKRVSVSSGGAQGSGGSGSPAISANGRKVAFSSAATNLVGGDSNGDAADIFVRNLRTGKTRRVSVSSTGVQAGGDSIDASISADGRRVAFESFATNLVGGDSNGVPDVFVRNLKTGKTRRVSVSSGGAQGNGSSIDPSISADGRRIAFRSFATNLVGGDSNGAQDVFVRNLKTGKTRRVSVSSGGAQGNSDSFIPSISADGRKVAFSSAATNLVGVDSNGRDDVFVRNLKTGKTRRVSVSSAGAQGNGSSIDASISADGRRVAFDSVATNLVGGDSNGALDVFVRNLKTGKTRRVSVSSAGAQGNGSSSVPSISADGRRVAFDSGATNLVGGDTNGVSDVFLRRPRR